MCAHKDTQKLCAHVVSVFVHGRSVACAGRESVCAMEQEDASVLIDPFDTEIFPGELRKLIVRSFDVLERIMWQRTCKRHALDTPYMCISSEWNIVWSSCATKSLAGIFYRVLKEAPRWLRDWGSSYYNNDPGKDYFVFEFCIGLGPTVKLLACGENATVPNSWCFRNQCTRKCNTASTLAELGNGSAKWQTFLNGSSIRTHSHISWAIGYEVVRNPYVPKEPYTEATGGEKVYMWDRDYPVNTPCTRETRFEVSLRNSVLKSFPVQLSKQPRLNAWNYNKKNKRK